jgi:epoxyqueuosine reductase QueG
MFDLENVIYSDILPMGVCSFSKLKNNLISCRAMERIPQNARSVIVVLFPYYLGDGYYENLNISKYAVPTDYHKICTNYLKEITDSLKMAYPNSEFQYFCDNSPINEVMAAVFAGLGVKGENSLLINEKYGSFCFVGEIVTDLEIECEERVVESCKKCGLCRKKCINKAITTNGIESEKCLSSITQKKGNLTKDEEELISKSGCIWGCDICQDICPMNKSIRVSPIKEFYEDAKSSYNGDEDYSESRAFSWRKKDVINRNLKIML